jgi:hypothetical protein
MVLSLSQQARGNYVYGTKVKAVWFVQPWSIRKWKGRILVLIGNVYNQSLRLVPIMAVNGVQKTKGMGEGLDTEL